MAPADRQKLVLQVVLVAEQHQRKEHACDLVRPGLPHVCAAVAIHLGPDHGREEHVKLQALHGFQAGSKPAAGSNLAVDAIESTAPMLA